MTDLANIDLGDGQVTLLRQGRSTLSVGPRTTETEFLLMCPAQALRANWTESRRPYSVSGKLWGESVAGEVVFSGDRLTEVSLCVARNSTGAPARAFDLKDESALHRYHQRWFRQHAGDELPLEMVWGSVEAILDNRTPQAGIFLRYSEPVAISQ